MTYVPSDRQEILDKIGSAIGEASIDEMDDLLEEARDHILAPQPEPRFDCKSAIREAAREIKTSSPPHKRAAIRALMRCLTPGKDAAVSLQLAAQLTAFATLPANPPRRHGR